MFRRSSPAPATVPSSSVDLSQPHDACLKCGRPTPLGVSLCERDNPAAIRSPSTTQVHGTILIGVVAGFVLLAIVLRLGANAGGPFESSVVGWAPRSDGGLDVVVRVVNDGARASGTSCRISAGGAPDFRDYVFFSEPLAAGETRDFSRVIPAPPNGASVQPRQLAVHCS